MKKARIEKEINPKVSIFLFSKEKPKGEIFKFAGGKDSEEYKAMLENGYFDSPAQLDLPKEESLLTTEQVERMRPEDLKAMLESYGFIVLTPEQLKAEVNKLVSTHIDITEFTDEALIAEAERRGLKEGEQEEHTEFQLLREQFKEDPVRLTKDELIKLGNHDHDLGLKKTMKEETLIAKITEALNAK